ncbi:hypothetical protein [Kitasatospora terrestris]
MADRRHLAGAALRLEGGARLENPLPGVTGHGDDTGHRPDLPRRP